MQQLTSNPIYLRKGVYLSGPLRRIVFVAAVLILLTSSFDIFLVIEAGGVYRFCQILLPFVIVPALSKAIRGSIVPVLGALPLCIWIVVQIVFVPATEFWPKSLGYCLWLIFNFGLVFSFVQLFQETWSLLLLLRCYAYSFAVVAVFGIVQFILPLAGFRGVLITQWWIPGQLARVNGFSYEPSYFATYLLTGFVFTGSLRRNHCRLLRVRTLIVIYCSTGLAILLSSSRMGITFLCMEILLSQLQPCSSFLAGVCRLRLSPRALRPLFLSLLSITAISVSSAGAWVVLEHNPALALLFLNGTGISDTAAHSLVQRESALEETFAVFLEHPLIGRSLGGVSSAIAEQQGEKVDSFQASKDFEGMSVFAEALAASGLIGVIPFACFVAVTFWKPLRLARHTDPFYSTLLKALLRALLFEWMILQFNQNILRPYLWTHMAVLATVYAAAFHSVRASSRDEQSV